MMPGTAGAYVAAGEPTVNGTMVVPAGGAPPSFETVYRETYPGLVRLAVLMMGDNRVAEELVQEAFVTVYRRWSRIDTPRAFARQCVVNRCRDALRRRQVADRLHRRQGTRDMAEDPAGTHDGHVDDLLAVLSPRQRAVIVLRYYEDLGIDDIALVLDLRPGTVKSLLSRGLTRLRNEDIQW